jgi:preprotein translocase subunit SecB
MLSKQAIRSGTQISVNGESISKEDLIHLSEKWNEKEETLFRKMLKQGGVFKIQGITFKIMVLDVIYDSKGEISVPLKYNDEE